MDSREAEILHRNFAKVRSSQEKESSGLQLTVFGWSGKRMISPETDKSPRVGAESELGANSRETDSLKSILFFHEVRLLLAL